MILIHNQRPLTLLTSVVFESFIRIVIMRDLAYELFYKVAQKRHSFCWTP